MAMLTSTAMTGLRQYIKRTVAYARYKLDGTYIRTTLTDVTIDGSGVVRISFMCEPQSDSGGKVTEVQLYDHDGQLWLSKAVNLDMDTIETGFFELIKITITEEDT